MKTAVIFDCEYLTTETSMQRFWSGPFDPDPTVVQIGAVHIDLTGDFQILDTLKVYISPLDRVGQPAPLDPFFTQLTSITQDRINAVGVTLADALARFDAFSHGAPLWCWGKDELYFIAISCYIHGIAPPLPAARFRNLTRALIKAGLPADVVHATRSNGVAGLFDIDTTDLTAHDGLDDALSLTYAVQHLLRSGRLLPDDLVQ